MAGYTGDIVTMANTSYEQARKSWNSVYQRTPSEMLYPLGIRQVKQALTYVQERNLPFRIQSGGHSFDGYSSLDDGIVINMSRMTSIDIRDDETVVVGPAASLGDIYESLAGRDLAIPGGTCLGVGAAGLALGGGIGVLGRSHGWLAQSIRSLDVVDAHANLLTVDKDNHPDLFWALRGAGGNNFGIVVSLTLQTYRIPEVLVGAIEWDWEHLVDVADAFQQWLPTLNSRINVTAALPPRDRGQVSVMIVSLASPKQTDRAMSDLLALSPPARRRTLTTRRYADAIADPIDRAVLYSDQIRATAVMPCTKYPLSRSVLARIGAHLAVAKDETAVYLYGLGPSSVAADRHRQDPVALPHTDALMAVYSRAYWTDPKEDQWYFGWMRGLARDILPHCETTYINSHDIHIDDRVYPRYGESFARLVDVKHRYDPNNVFAFEAGIPPSLTRERAHSLGLPQQQINAIKGYGLLVGE